MTHERKEVRLTGYAASSGVVHGPAFVFLRRELEVPSYLVGEEEIPAELDRLDQAIVTTQGEIRAIQGDIAKRLGTSEAQIFDAHLLVLEDRALVDEIIREIGTSRHNAAYCTHQVCSRYIEAFSNIEDHFFRERVADIRDVYRRLMKNLMGMADTDLERLSQGKIIVADDLTPSDTVGLERGKVLAIATDGGSATSHAAIMARSLEVPSVVGMHNATEKIQAGDILLVDGYNGELVINPSEQTLYEYGQLQLHRENEKRLYAREASFPPLTRDGQELPLRANVEGFEDPARIKASGARGVGLYRTEALFMRQDRFPSEDEQFAAYKRIVEGLAPDVVTIRTLDLGGDKVAPSHRVEEDNPFMGFRAIRFCLEHPDVFKTQLRAILRASAFGNIAVMFPMISGVHELIQAKRLLEECREELRGAKVPFREDIKVGSMIEIPSAACVADLLAEHCDFFSIGTNDLIQYMLAVDRINDRVAHLYEPNHPAIIRTLKKIITAARDKEISVSVCGELAGDPLYAPLLLGMGATELSATPSLLPQIKFIVRNIRHSDACALAEKVLAMSDPAEIFKALHAFNRQYAQPPENPS